MVGNGPMARQTASARGPPCAVGQGMRAGSGAAPAAWTVTAGTDWGQPDSDESSASVTDAALRSS